MNLDAIFTQGQIAFALLVIALVLAYTVFGKKPHKSKK